MKQLLVLFFKSISSFTGTFQVNSETLLRPSPTPTCYTDILKRGTTLASHARVSPSNMHNDWEEQKVTLIA